LGHAIRRCHGKKRDKDRKVVSIEHSGTKKKTRIFPHPALGDFTEHNESREKRGWVGKKNQSNKRLGSELRSRQKEDPEKGGEKNLPNPREKKKRRLFSSQTQDLWGGGAPFPLWESKTKKREYRFALSEKKTYQSEKKKSSRKHRLSEVARRG